MVFRQGGRLPYGIILRGGGGGNACLGIERIHDNA